MGVRLLRNVTRVATASVQDGALLALALLWPTVPVLLQGPDSGHMDGKLFSSAAVFYNVAFMGAALACARALARWPRFEPITWPLGAGHRGTLAFAWLLLPPLCVGAATLLVCRASAAFGAHPGLVLGGVAQIAALGSLLLRLPIAPGVRPMLLLLAVLLAPALPETGIGSLLGALLGVATWTARSGFPGWAAALAPILALLCLAAALPAGRAPGRSSPATSMGDR